MGAHKPTESEITAYLSFIQNIISRMNANSMQCKLVCITLCAGLLAVYASSSVKMPYLILVFMAVVQVVFLCLDAKYLALERHFRNLYNEKVKKNQVDEISNDELFVIKAKNISLCEEEFREALLSWSVWPVYLVLCLSEVFLFFIGK